MLCVNVPETKSSTRQYSVLLRGEIMRMDNINICQDLPKTTDRPHVPGKTSTPGLQSRHLRILNLTQERAALIERTDSRRSRLARVACVRPIHHKLLQPSRRQRNCEVTNTGFHDVDFPIRLRHKR